MNIEALLRTADILEQVRDDAFNLYSFVGRNYKEDKFAEAISTERTILVPHNCGCTACATGYAGLDPWFVERGFETTLSGDIYYKNKGQEGWEAVYAFYGLSYQQAHYLFDSDSYASLTDRAPVIARLREFAAGDGTVPAHQSYEHDDPEEYKGEDSYFDDEGDG